MMTETNLKPRWLNKGLGDLFEINAVETPYERPTFRELNEKENSRTSLDFHSLSIPEINNRKCFSLTGSEVYSQSPGVEKTYLFLPPTKPKHKENPVTESVSTTEAYSEMKSALTMGSVPLMQKCSHEHDITSDGGLSLSSTSGQFSFDASKLENITKKDFLLSCFKNQASLSSLSQNSDLQLEKPHSLKVKNRFRKFGQAARNFLHKKIHGERATIQRYEVLLTGQTDTVEQLILVISSSSVAAPTFYFPTQLDQLVVLPKSLLPTKIKGVITVSAYGLVDAKEKNLEGFRKVYVSGSCKFHAENKVLVRASLELQPTKPHQALMKQNTSLNLCTISINYTKSSHYTLQTHPTPISEEFTELLILQTATPFQEYISLASSTCDHPAAFEVYLEAGKYHAACSFRLSKSHFHGIFSLSSAACNFYFKSYLNKAEVTELLIRAAEMTQNEDHSLLLPLSYLSLTKPYNFDLESLLYKCKINIDRDEEHIPIKVKSTTSVSFMKNMDGLCFAACATPAKTGKVNNADHFFIPPLTVFNMNTRLYFVDFWSYYDQHYITLVITTKGSESQKFCKEHLYKLDPYKNPFFYRKRLLFPEPSVKVYASEKVKVKVFFSDTSDVKNLISVCSESVFYSKVQMLER